MVLCVLNNLKMHPIFHKSHFRILIDHQCDHCKRASDIPIPNLHAFPSVLANDDGLHHPSQVPTRAFDLLVCDASALSLDTTGMGIQSPGWRESVTQALPQVLGPLFSVILLPTLPFCLWAWLPKLLLNLHVVSIRGSSSQISGLPWLLYSSSPGFPLPARLHRLFLYTVTIILHRQASSTQQRFSSL